jgi:hypothetical protein
VNQRQAAFPFLLSHFFSEMEIEHYHHYRRHWGDARVAAGMVLMQDNQRAMPTLAAVGQL